MLGECKVIPVIPTLLDHPVPHSSPFSPLTHGQKIATVVSGDTIKKKKEGGGRGWNMKRKSALKNKWSRSKCQGVLREAVPVCPQAFRSKVQ